MIKKIGVPLSNLNRSVKPGWEITLEGQVKKITVITRENAKDGKTLRYFRMKRPKQNSRHVWQLEELKQKIMAKKRKLKRCSKCQVIQTKQDFTKNWKKISTNKWMDNARGTNQQSDAKEAKQFWSKIWEQKGHNRKAEWINNIGKRITSTLRSIWGGNTSEINPSNS